MLSGHPTWPRPWDERRGTDLDIASGDIAMKTTAIVVVVLLVVAVAAVLIYAAMKPDTFRIARSASIKAPPEKIFALLQDFRLFPSWSPWETIDPALERTYGGAASGKGATYDYQGNKKVGAGHMEIVEAEPPSRVVIKLDFIRPFEAHNLAEFTLDPAGDTTRVTWTMHGPSPYVSKLMTTFVSIDRMVGPQFEKGLANLKVLTEK
jgi:uncharacterized protein YndB with AHSA1/START domain